MNTKTGNRDRLVMQTALIVKAYVTNNNVPVGDMAGLILGVSTSLADVGALAARPDGPELPTPAVPVRKSVTPDYLICLEDGKHFKSLKRHLATRFRLTPEAYRARWGLPADYPMVAANYGVERSRQAKRMGLGRKRPRITT